MEKAEHRAAALERRSALSEAERAEKSALICRRLLGLEVVRGAKMVMSYMAFGAECDLTELHDKLREQGKTLVFPVCGRGGVMDAYEPVGDKWIVSKFGVSEPDIELSKIANPEDIDLVIVPCVAFDGKKQRIGYGAGYYDRFLPRCPNAGTVIAAFEAQKVDIIQNQEHDIPVEFVVTEKVVY